MAKKSRVLIITPGLTYIGGTELETLVTAKIFFENNVAEEVVIFSPVKASNSIIENYNEKRIVYWNYPHFFSLGFVQRIDGKFKKIFKLFKRNFSPLQFLYWWVITLFYRFRFCYIITDSAQFYYAPSLINLKLDKTLIKFTSCFFSRPWNSLQKSLLEKTRLIMVTAHSQKLYLSENYNIKNVCVIDVFIWNENNLLQISPNQVSNYTFGMLCRISKEKGLEEGIVLVKKLKDNGVIANLLIRGPSKDRKYLEFLKQLIKELNIESNITIDTSPLKPKEIPTFFEIIKIFLITSKFEGGPNTGLESMAAGLPVLSYSVGAMPERLSSFKDLLIAEDMEELLEKSIFLINMKKEEYDKLSEELRKHYIDNFSNQSILSSTLKYINTN